MAETAGQHGWTDQKLENIVGNLLRTGVSLAALVVFIGGIIYLIRHGREPVNYHVFQGEPSDLKTVPGIIRSALGLHGRGIIQFGLLLLIATPVFRVALSIWGFAAEKDRMYMLFTAIVLIVLLYSLLGFYRLRLLKPISRRCLCGDERLARPGPEMTTSARLVKNPPIRDPYGLARLPQATPSVLTTFQTSFRVKCCRLLLFRKVLSIKGAEAVMKRLWIAACLVLPLAALMAVELPSGDSWSQWAKNPQHTGFIQLSGQSASHKLAEIRYDRFVNQEKRDDFGVDRALPGPVDRGRQRLHGIQNRQMDARVTLVTPGRPGQHAVPIQDKQIWNEKRLDWNQGETAGKVELPERLEAEPNAAETGLVGGNRFPSGTDWRIYLTAGFGGTVWKVNKSDGKAVAQINPFGTSIMTGNKYVSGRYCADPQGDVYYNVIKLDPSNPWTADVLGSWLVKVAADGTWRPAVTFEKVDQRSSQR